jgi:AraC-like DNA-binding protein
MDVLSDLLRAVRLTGAIFFEMRNQAPWVGHSPHSSAIAAAVMPDAEHVINFHAVLSGSCYAALAPTPERYELLQAGDIVVFPHGDANFLCSAPGMTASPDLSLYSRPTDRHLPFVLRLNGGSAEQCQVICGYLGCDRRPFNPLLDALPQMLYAPISAMGQSWLASLIRVAADESEAGSAGGETMLAKLAELMFVEVVRKYLDHLPSDAPGWLSGLRDRQVGQALRLIHGEPARDWTLDALAREVSLSRSVFANRFGHYVGVTPMQYVARWRMQLAARRLEVPGLSIAQVGAEVGYESEAAFNRAFKKYVGTPPGAWRKRRGARGEAGAAPA